MKKLKKPPQKVPYLWQFAVFFSAAQTAQNSPKLHFRFIKSFIQPSLVGSLAGRDANCQDWSLSPYILFSFLFCIDHHYYRPVKKLLRNTIAYQLTHSVGPIQGQRPRGDRGGRFFTPLLLSSWCLLDVMRGVVHTKMSKTASNS